MWWLLSASGQPVPWAGTLTTTKVNGKSVLAEPYLTGIGWVNFPVYTFSGDSGYGASCSANAACQRAWPSVLTSGSPGDQGVSASVSARPAFPVASARSPGTASRSTCSSHEELIPLPNGSAAAVGNGNGVKAFGGTFSLVVNP